MLSSASFIRMWDIRNDQATKQKLHQKNKKGGSHPEINTTQTNKIISVHRLSLFQTSLIYSRAPVSVVLSKWRHQIMAQHINFLPTPKSKKGTFKLTHPPLIFHAVSSPQQCWCQTHRGSEEGRKSEAMPKFLSCTLAYRQATVTLLNLGEEKKLLTNVLCVQGRGKKYNIPIIAVGILDWKQRQAAAMTVKTAFYVLRLKPTQLKLGNTDVHLPRKASECPERRCSSS